MTKREKWVWIAVIGICALAMLAAMMFLCLSCTIGGMALPSDVAAIKRETESCHSRYWNKPDALQRCFAVARKGGHYEGS